MALLVVVRGSSAVRAKPDRIGQLFAPTTCHTDQNLYTTHMNKKELIENLKSFVLLVILFGAMFLIYIR